MESVDLKLPRYMIYCVFVSSIGSFCNGWVIGSANVPGEVTHACLNGTSHIASSVFPDCLLMNDALWGFAVASFCVGGIFGGLSGGALQSKFGRKYATIYNTVGWIFGALLIGVSVNPAMFIIGRIFCGISCGIGSLCTPMYISEVSTSRFRGAMSACNQFAIVIGILLASVIGLPLAYVPLWRINYTIVAIPAIAQFILMFTCVESPRYLISINCITEARESLQKLRHNSNIDTEFFGMLEGQLGTAAARAFVPNECDSSQIKEDLKSISTQVEDISSQQKISTQAPMNIIGIFTDPQIRPIALIVITLHCIQQLIGMNAVMYYSTTIFNMSFDADMSKYMAIVSTVFNFASTIASLFLIDRVGRRPLLITAEIGACIFSILLVIGYVYSIGPLLTVSVFGYVISFAIGVGPVPWMMTSELSPVYASSAVGAVATAFNYATNFLIGQCFPLIFEKIKGYSFAIFAGVAALALLFSYYKVPETNGQPLESISKGFMGEKA
ncbi:uncharacterized protein ATC70_003066 [Mucor velutinosus]|uniref:Major facilitator superfamily (MFS) profile domain-containing protein n=1 Tax=Mucor velutinosus TaxID=708070 RepID=A0AAN7D8X3_9FUNG|nr:hypothetical protein ATC70_003066 [Mucor velutinosus]